MKNIFIIWLFLISLVNYAQVGIGTSTPVKELHISGNTSTIRIEGLDDINQSALNQHPKLTPVFVNANGDLTLKPTGYDGSGGVSNSIEPLNFLISIPNFIPSGTYGDGTVVANPIGVTNASAQLVSVPFSCPQSALIEVRYAMTIDLSDQVLPAPGGSTFNDISARTVRCFFCIDLNNDGLDAAERSKVYGLHGEAYTSYDQGSIGYAFIHGVGYGNIPQGNHSLVFFGESTDGNNRQTYVGFGGSSDYLKIRIYN